jgi:hypothetical protein
MNNNKVLSILMLFSFILFGCNSHDDLPWGIEAHRTILFSFLPIDYILLEQLNGGMCHFDRIIQVENKEIVVEGWAIPSPQAEGVAETILIGIHDEGHEQFGIVNTQTRGDVSTFFNNSNLSNAGFIVRLKNFDVKNNSCLTVYQSLKGKLIKCPTNLLINKNSELIRPCL